MRISIIVQDRFHAFDYARELHRLGYLHQLITPYPRMVTSQYGVPSSKVTSLIHLGAIQRCLRYLPIPQKLRNKFELWWLQFYANAAAKALQECDVVIAWSSVGSPAFEKAHKWGALRICERGSSHILTQERLLKEEHAIVGLPWTEWTEKKRRLELNDYSNADLIQVPSGFARSSFLANGFSDSRVIQTTYGVNLAAFTPSAPRIKSPFRVLYVGSLSLRKGIHYLVKGFESANLGEAELWLVGSVSSETDRLVDTASSHIHQIGPVTQSKLGKFYSVASAFVIASIEEGLAMVQAQALSSGLPLICTTNTGGEDLLKLSGSEPLHIGNDILQYPAGFVVPIRRPECIARCLEMLAGDPLLYFEMSKAAAQIAASRMDWSQSVAKMVTILSKELY